MMSPPRGNAGDFDGRTAGITGCKLLSFVFIYSTPPQALAHPVSKRNFYSFDFRIVYSLVLVIAPVLIMAIGNNLKYLC